MKLNEGGTDKISSTMSALGHSRPGRAGRRSSHVRYAPKATVGHQNAIGRDGPTADSCAAAKSLLFDHLVGRLSSGDGLTYLEALKFRMLQIERPGCLVASTRVRGPKFFRLRPRLEGPLALPHAVRGIERIIFRSPAP
jgi:hypothetical protein